MADENKVQEVEQKVEETAPKAEETPVAKKGVDINELASKGKDGLNKGVSAVSSFYAQDAKKGILIGQVVPVFMFLLALIFGKGALGIILMVLVAAANYVGLEAIKKGLSDKPKTEK